MNPTTKKILEYLNTENTKFLFSYIKPDFSNLDEVYQNNLNLWFCNNSDEKTTKDSKGVEITNGILLNPDNIIFSKTKNGFELTEIDFINDQIKYINKLDFESLTFAEKKQFETYKSFLSNKQNPPQQVENFKTDEVKNIHPKFNPNYWNKECFELFKYIYDEYYKGTKRQLTNIWFYLKEYQSTNYILKATKEQYETFILENYQIKITNFDKAQTKWEDKEYGTINDHRINFEDSLK